MKSLSKFTENNHGKLNRFEDIEIPKAASSDNTFSNVINGRKDKIYRIRKLRYGKLDDGNIIRNQPQPLRILCKEFG